MKRVSFLAISIIFHVVLSTTTFAQEQHQLVRRMVVFPFQSDQGFSGATSEMWWKIREALTEDRRFLVASKSFLQRKDVFQTRGALRPADVIILGELLDAHVIITGEFKNRDLTMMAYESTYGRLVWKQNIRLHPSLPVGEQLPTTGEKLARDFVSSIPYHGFVIKDSLIGQVVYQENQNSLIQAEVGTRTKLSLGDKFQLVRVTYVNDKPLFLGGARLEVFAEGEVLSMDQGIAVMRVLRATSLSEVEENTLVRFPSEVKRLKDLYAIKDSLKRHVSPEYFAQDLNVVDQETRETKPLVAALTFIVNIATVLLLAF